MRLEGSLDAFSLPDIFALLAMTKKTGALELSGAKSRGVVHFTSGAITGAVSDVSRQALGRRLVAAGALADQALAEAVERVATQPDVGLARALAQAGALDDALLHEAVSEQTIDAVFDLLRWLDGDFAFLVDAANPDDVGVSLPVEEVVGEARRRLDAWASVAATVPSPDTVLCLALGLAEPASIAREEWGVLALVDGRRSVAEVCRLAGRGEYAVVSILAGLVRRGLLRVDENDGVAALVRRQGLLSRLERAAEPTRPEPAQPEVLPPVEPERLEVTPQRPEPFLPRRRPEHPEEFSGPLVGGAAGRVATAGLSVEGTAAVAPLPGEVGPLIGRDPSVNKSLLLRLIAGVRGL